MKKFNLKREKRKLWLRTHKWQIIKYGSVFTCGMILMLAIMYFSHASFSTTVTFDVIDARVAPFSNGDIILTYNIDGVDSNTIMENNGTKYKLSSYTCDNSEVITWDNNTWSVNISNMSSKVKCKLYFEMTIPVTSVALTGNNEVNEGENITLTATVTPSNADNTNISWSSNNTSSLNVNNCPTTTTNGVATCTITAGNSGSATITLTSDDDNTKSATKTIDITSSSAQIIGITITKLGVGAPANVAITLSKDDTITCYAQKTSSESYVNESNWSAEWLQSSSALEGRGCINQFTSVNHQASCCMTNYACGEYWHYKVCTSNGQCETDAVTGTCFTGDTKIYLSNGFVMIKDIKVGNMIYTYNEKTKKVEVNKVLRKFEHHTDELYKIEIDNQIIKTTKIHPFYVKKKNSLDYKWIKAGDIDKGDYLYTSEGKEVIVDNIIDEKLNNTITVYNLEVDGNHDYYVGDGKYLVHNKSC